MKLEYVPFEGEVSPVDIVFLHPFCERDQDGGETARTVRLADISSCLAN